jgi:hypothetical protein
MIPPDVASSLRQILPDQQTAANNAQTQPVSPVQRITDVLSNLVPGQRIMAEIQAMLPNGTYRAVVSQRDITLALPFSAKAGDSLELEVVESDGKVTLALVANRTGGEAAAKANDSVATTLSQTGKLIGNLLGGIDDQGKRAAPAPLNGNRPLVNDFPNQAATLAPVLKEALTKSGVFYEAHQARWVAGKLPTEALRQEPQGKTLPSMPATGPAINSASTASAALAPTPPSASTLTANLANTPNTAPPSGLAPASAPVGALPDDAKASTELPGQAAQTQGKAQATTGVNVAVDAAGKPEITSATSNTPAASRAEAMTQSNTSPIPRDLTPIVQQQLDALATQNYAWQGQVWPGQKMWWEITENPENDRSADSEIAGRWQTRLKLSLPMLGGIDAVLRLRPNGEVDISMTTDSTNSESRLRESAAALRSQMEAAGLNLTQLLVQLEQHGETVE